jgi:hypothetical protein
LFTNSNDMCSKIKTNSWEPIIETQIIALYNFYENQTSSTYGWIRSAKPAVHFLFLATFSTYLLQKHGTSLPFTLFISIFKIYFKIEEISRVQNVLSMPIWRVHGRLVSWKPAQGIQLDAWTTSRKRECIAIATYWNSGAN